MNEIFDVFFLFLLLKVKNQRGVVTLPLTSASSAAGTAAADALSRRS